MSLPLPVDSEPQGPGQWFFCSFAMKPTEPILSPRSRWLRWVWFLCGAFCLLTGLVGIALPLLPTTPFVLLAAYCFSRASPRCEQWLLAHPRFGPIVHDWRAKNAVPLAAKQWALGTLGFSSALAWWCMPAYVRWIPGIICAVVALWLWRLPNAGKSQS